MAPKYPPLIHARLEQRALQPPEPRRVVARVAFDPLAHRTFEMLHAHGLRDFKSAGALHFSQYDQVIQAAIAPVNPATSMTKSVPMINGAAPINESRTMSALAVST